MLRHVLKINLELRSNYFLFSSKRFKGHSHWQNIKQTKTSNDLKRSLQITMYMRKLQGIVNFNKGDTNPKTNPALASVLEQAKKENLPEKTFQNFLKKLANREGVSLHNIFLKAPDNYVIAVSYDKSRQQFFRQAMKKACRDHKIALTEVPPDDNLFCTKGIIVSKAPSNDITLEKVEEDAIIAGAEEVEEIESADKEEKVFQFITLFGDLFKVLQSLQEQGWSTYEHKHQLVPLYCVKLPEEKISQVLDFVSTLEEIPEVDKVVINIA